PRHWVEIDVAIALLVADPAELAGRRDLDLHLPAARRQHRPERADRFDLLDLLEQPELGLGVQRALDRLLGGDQGETSGISRMRSSFGHAPGSPPWASRSFGIHPFAGNGPLPSLES